MIVAPSSPPMRAWLLELGMPSRQVIRFQAMAPISAAAHDGLRRGRLVDEPGADRLGDGGPGEGADEVERGRHEDRVAGRRARVATEVAIAFAVSWKPLM